MEKGKAGRETGQGGEQCGACGGFNIEVVTVPCYDGDVFLYRCLDCQKLVTLGVDVAEAQAVEAVNLLQGCLDNYYAELDVPVRYVLDDSIEAEKAKERRRVVTYKELTNKNRGV